jgi:hypothetical protein
MASNRPFIIVQSPLSANKIIAYEGTSGSVPWDLGGEYTTEAKARQAIEAYYLKKEQLAPVVNPEPPLEPLRGNSKRK